MEKAVDVTYSIVMPVYLREESHRSVVIDTLENVTRNSNDYELIVVDDGSPLSTGFVKEYCNVFIQHQENLGIAPSWNDGKNVARGDYVAIINDDIRVPEGWLVELRSCFGEDELCGVSGVGSAGPKVSPNIEAWGPVKDYEWFSGYCFMLKPDRFFEDFDERFIPANCEDTDYWHRVLNEGYELYKAPVTIWHKEGDVLHGLDYEKISNEAIEKFKDKWGFDPRPEYYPT